MTVVGAPGLTKPQISHGNATAGSALSLSGRRMNKNPANHPSKRDLKLYGLSMRVAENSSCTDRHGAVIANNGRVLSLADNRMVSSPTSARWLKESLHAEQRAILRVGATARGSTCYMARAHASDTSGPCVMCRALLVEAGVHRIVYSLGGGEVVAEKLSSVGLS